MPPASRRMNLKDDQHRWSGLQVGLWLVGKDVGVVRDGKLVQVHHHEGWLRCTPTAHNPAMPQAWMPHVARTRQAHLRPKPSAVTVSPQGRLVRQPLSGHSSGQSSQALSNTNQHYLDEGGSRDRTSEHDTTFTGSASINVADLQNQCAGETRWAGSIPVRLRYLPFHLHKRSPDAGTQGTTGRLGRSALTGL